MSLEHELFALLGVGRLQRLHMSGQTGDGRRFEQDPQRQLDLERLAEMQESLRNEEDQVSKALMAIISEAVSSILY